MTDALGVHVLKIALVINFGNAIRLDVFGLKLVSR